MWGFRILGFRVSRGRFWIRGPRVWYFRGLTSVTLQNQGVSVGTLGSVGVRKRDHTRASRRSAQSAGRGVFRATIRRA